MIRYELIPGAYATHLQGITPIGLAINHLHDLFMHALARRVAGAPVVARADAIFADVEILRVVDVFVGAGLNAVDDLRALILLGPSISKSLLEVRGPAGWLEECIACRRTGISSDEIMFVQIRMDKLDRRTHLSDHCPRSQSPRGCRLG